MLSLVNNLAALDAQNNLNKANTALNTSLQRLSSGLRINSGADDPAGLVISNEQMAQISGLQSAITNTSKATNVVQIADGALNETSALLLQIRGLAVDAANSGANDATSLAADQAQISNALNTITRISNSTQFGSNQLLNGSHAATATTGSNLYSATATGTIASGSYSVSVTTAGTAATVAGGANAASEGNTGETLTINNVQIAIAANANTTAELAAINAASGSTGVQAVMNGNVMTLYSTQFGSGHQITVTSSAGTASATGLTAAGAVNKDGTDIVGTIDGLSASGVGNTLTATTGTAVGLSVTVAPDSTTTYTSATNNPFTTDNAGTTVTVDASQALLFQIGANAGQSATLAIQNTSASSIGQGVSSVFANLNLINVTSATNTADVLKVVDKAINDISGLAGTLGAFQDNTLQATANNLQASLQNTTAANSTIRDTNFATETANFTQDQVLVQAGTQVLKNANQLPSLVLTLLQ